MTYNHDGSFENTVDAFARVVYMPEHVEELPRNIGSVR